MAKGRSPSELKSRTVRVNIGDYMLLAKLSHKLDKTMAEALHLAITDRAKQDQVTVTPRTQIPMPIVTTIYRTEPKTAIATNGSKRVAFRIKPRGARYD